MVIANTIHHPRLNLIWIWRRDLFLLPKKKGFVRGSGSNFTADYSYLIFCKMTSCSVSHTFIILASWVSFSWASFQIWNSCKDDPKSSNFETPIVFVFRDFKFVQKYTFPNLQSHIYVYAETRRNHRCALLLDFGPLMCVVGVEFRVKLWCDLFMKPSLSYHNTRPSIFKLYRLVRWKIEPIFSYIAFFEQYRKKTRRENRNRIFLTFYSRE